MHRKTFVVALAIGLAFGQHGLSAVKQLLLLGGGSAAYAQAEGVPTGAILLIVSGACPTGYVEETSLNGRLPIGTLAANANIGTTGGADNITPAGTNAALTFTGTLSTAVVNHTHALATGTGATGNFSQVIGTIDTSSGGTGGAATQSALGTLSGNPTAGGAASYTPAGTINTPSFTGTPFDNRSAFVRTIFCRKT